MAGVLRHEQPPAHKGTQSAGVLQGASGLQEGTRVFCPRPWVDGAPGPPKQTDEGMLLCTKEKNKTHFPCDFPHLSPKVVFVHG